MLNWRADFLLPAARATQMQAPRIAAAEKTKMCTDPFGAATKIRQIHYAAASCSSISRGYH